jgi:hypothetical protein
MFSGDPNFPRVDKNSATNLGMEARSILKSIRTEETKLVNSTDTTRSDHYYFRARANYYKLSLLRLTPEERQMLEPVLARFHKSIQDVEDRVKGTKEPLTPFLEAVEKVPDISAPEARQPAAEPVRAELPRGQKIDSDYADNLVSQLSLLQLALNAELSAESKKILGDGVQRIIREIRFDK